MVRQTSVGSSGSDEDAGRSMEWCRVRFDGREEGGGRGRLKHGMASRRRRVGSAGWGRRGVCARKDG